MRSDQHPPKLPTPPPPVGPTAVHRHVDTTVVGAIADLDVTVADPTVADPTVAGAAWGRALGVTPTDDVLEVDDAAVRFVAAPAADPARHGIIAVDLVTGDPVRTGTIRDLLGVTLRVATG